jgi:hypothetical protein
MLRHLAPRMVGSTPSSWHEGCSSNRTAMVSHHRRKESRRSASSRRRDHESLCVFSSTEPVLILTRQTIRSRAVQDELRRIGCLKFIAREVPIKYLRSRYGEQFDVIEEAVHRGCALRVLDYSGRRIFRYLPFSEFGPAYRRELTPFDVAPSREPAGTASAAIFGSPSQLGFG